MPLAAALQHLAAGTPLSESQAEQAFESLLAGEASEVQIAALLSLIQARGASVDELVGAARAMRRHVTPVPYAGPGVVIDTCGTGGAPKTFNISTVAALVAAAAGEGALRVAKHGNRSRSGRGSAEVLAALGVNVDASPEVQAQCLERAGVCFCFAIHHHPAAKHAAGVRKALGFPTIFNLLGPLTNPAGAKRQLLGVYERAAVEKLARALARLGSERALVAHGDDGMDEITTTTVTHVAEAIGPSVGSGAGAAAGAAVPQVRVAQINPSVLGVPMGRREDLEARDLPHAVAIAEGVLRGERGPPRDIVTLNAGVALAIGGVAPTYAEGITRAAAAIDSGAARETLRILAETSRA